jgi:hypothetical protein
VLGGEPGYRQCPELLQLAKGRIAIGDFLPELVVSCFEISSGTTLAALLYALTQR